MDSETVRVCPVAFRLVLLLGSARVFDFRDTDPFHRFENDALLQVTKIEHLADEHSFVGHWRSAIEAEQARRGLAVEAYREHVSNRDESVIHRYGFRDMRVLQSYVLDNVRRAIVRTSASPVEESMVGWPICQVSHNVVMNRDLWWKVMDPDPSLRAWLYFEFNDSDFVLKLENAGPNGKGNDADRVSQLLDNIQKVLVDGDLGANVPRRKVGY